MSNDPFSWLKLAEILLPALVAAVVGGLTAWIGNRQLKTTAKLTLQQMELSAKLANEQIAANLAVARMSYRAQVLSANRQAWINDVRNVVSDILAILERYRLTMDADDGFTWELVERFELNRARLRLLLNLNEAQSKAVMAEAEKLHQLAANKLEPSAEYKAASDALKSTTALLLKSEWERVKSGE